MNYIVFLFARRKTLTAISLPVSTRKGIVPWIALNDAHDNRPVVIYSQMVSHPIGEILPKLV
jgi:hypothetical protein